MIDITTYLNTLLPLLHQAFQDRLVYVGLQGSYLRGEAHDASDIDIMLIIADFTVADMAAYKQILHEIGHEELACGFICGLAEFRNWNPMEICQLLHTTKDYYGILKDLAPHYTMEDERNYVKMSLNNIFHEICHRYIHRPALKSREKLPGLYKPILYCIQNLHYLETGEFILKHAELADKICDEDRKVLELLTTNLTEADWPAVYEDVFTWCQRAMLRTGCTLQR